jgi:dephospho-CoA kinase
MRVIALTGRIGSGKSCVARYLHEFGAATIDADAIVHSLYREDNDLRQALRDRFGTTVVTPDGINRAELGRIVFADPQARLDLELLVHPRVHVRETQFLTRSRAAGFRVAVIEAVKIVESGGADMCEELWIVTCPEPIAIARLSSRGMSPDEALRRLSTQGDVPGWVTAFQEASVRVVGRPRSVVIIDNSGSLEEAYAQVERHAVCINGRGQHPLGFPVH